MLLFCFWPFSPEAHLGAWSSNAGVTDQKQVHSLPAEQHQNATLRDSQSTDQTDSVQENPVTQGNLASGQDDSAELEKTSLANPDVQSGAGQPAHSQIPQSDNTDAQHVGLSASDAVSETGSGADSAEKNVIDEKEPSEQVTDQSDISAARLEWHNVYSGMEIAWVKLPETLPSVEDTMLWIVRFDPGKVVFSVHMASQDGVAYTFRDWATKYRLYAAMNASMYLPDQITSTGYLRTEEHTNNARLGKRLGAVFVASPKVAGIPEADILEMEDPSFQKRVQQYRIAVQNFRFMSNDGELLWKNSQLMASFAIIGKDSSGRIYFVLCQQPLTPEQFASHIRRYGLPLTTSMYVEGGEQAGLLLRADDTVTQLLTRFKRDFYPIRKQKRGDPLGWYVFKGRKRYLNTKGAADMVIPNLLGVTPKMTIEQVMFPPADGASAK